MIPTSVFFLFADKYRTAQIRYWWFRTSRAFMYGFSDKDGSSGVGFAPTLREVRIGAREHIDAPRQR